MSLEFMESVRRQRVEKGTAALWWLGQNGFLLRSPRGTLLSIDAYLTDSIQRLHGDKLGLDFRRRVPVFVEPEELDVDYFLCTHSHDDHADPDTIPRLKQERIPVFAGPGLTCDKYRRLGIEPGKIRQLYAGGKLEAGDVVVEGMFALPTDDTDLDHLGFIITVEGGPRIYMTGDTDYSTLLEHVAKVEPDTMITCINGGFNNLSHWEAADLASAIRPKVAIPCHYDMFADNAVDPRMFRASLRIKAPAVEYQEMEHAKAFVLAAR
jgi:L-ascorbate 6-phosphate lactonase